MGKFYDDTNLLAWLDAGVVNSVGNRVKKRLDRFDGVGFFSLLIVPPAGHPWKAHCDSGAVPRALLDAFERQLEDQLRLDGAHRPELLDRVPPHEGIHFADLVVAESRIGLRERHQLPVVPDAEG